MFYKISENLFYNFSRTVSPNKKLLWSVKSNRFKIYRSVERNSIKLVRVLYNIWESDAKKYLNYLLVSMLTHM